MPRPLLPPKGVFVPSRIVYGSDIPPALLQTWIQLRGLAWGVYDTPLLKLTQIASIIGKPHATLYRHMAQLRDMGALSWRATGQGSIIVSFSHELTVASYGHPIPEEYEPPKKSQG